MHLQNLTVFQYNTKEVRTVMVNDEPWFVAKDVLAVMESKTTVTALETMVVEGLGKEFVNNQPLETNGGIQEMLCLSEAALTFFVSRSRTEMGKTINRWIHAEVLPTIRKTGSYGMAIAQPESPALPQNYIEALKALVAAEEQKALLEAEKQLLEEANHGLSEALDELFDYSSIVRIAKYNGVPETTFTWYRLKAASMKLGVEIKKAPCPRFKEKNLYSHDAWRLAYPDYRLPETTTLVIARDSQLNVGAQ